MQSSVGNGVCGFPGSASSRLEQLVRIEQDGDGAVVFRGDKHIGAELAVLRRKAAAAALLQELLIQRDGQLRQSRAREARPLALAAVGIERELADDCLLYTSPSGRLIFVMAPPPSDTMECISSII